MSRLLIFFIRIYQKCLSPILPGRCRFYPSCSQYWIDALKKYGLLKGVRRGLKRISKCHPWHPGGYDPA
ncbi:MAG: membrane protein insertion efficiency factor YidD [Dehalobacterium sp.]